MGDERYEDTEDTDEPMPMRSRIIATIVLIVVALGSLLLLMRLSSPAIAPSETAPAGHYPLPCTVCHNVTADAERPGTP